MILITIKVPIRITFIPNSVTAELHETRRIRAVPGSSDCRKNTEVDSASGIRLITDTVPVCRVHNTFILAHRPPGHRTANVRIVRHDGVERGSTTCALCSVAKYKSESPAVHLRLQSDHLLRSGFVSRLAGHEHVPNRAAKREAHTACMYACARFIQLLAGPLTCILRLSQVATPPEQVNTV